MRVAYVCIDAGIPVFGRKGGSVHVQEISRALVRRGAEVTLFASSLGGQLPSGLEGVRVVPVVASDADQDPRRFDCALYKLLKSEGGEFDLVYERHALWSASAMRFAQDTRAVGVLEVNAPLVDEQRRFRRLVEPDLADRIAIDAIQHATVRTVVSRGVAEAHARYGFTPDDFVVCPNGVSADRFSGVWRERLASEPFNIGFLGTLEPWHGVEVLLDAFDRVATEIPQSRLIFVGDGPMRSMIEERRESSPSGDRIELVGAVDPDEVPRQLSRFDVGLAPYPEADGHYFSPLKVFEYMAASLPVVASRVGQIPDLLSNRVEGLLVDPGSVPDLAVALIDLARNPDQARTMAEAGRARVLEHHSWDGVLQRILEAVGRGLPGSGCNRSTIGIGLGSISGSG